MAAITHSETRLGPMGDDLTGSADIVKFRVAEFGELLPADKRALLEGEPTPDLRAIITEETIDDFLKRFDAAMKGLSARPVGLDLVLNQRPGVRTVDLIHGHYGPETTGTAFTIIDYTNERDERQILADMGRFHRMRGDFDTRGQSRLPLDEAGFEKMVKAVELAEAVDSLDRNRTIAIKTGRTALAS